MQFTKGSKASRGVFVWAPRVLIFSIVFSVFAFQPLCSVSSSRVFAQEEGPAARGPAAPEAAPVKPAPAE